MKTLFYTFIICFLTLTAFAQDKNIQVIANAGAPVSFNNIAVTTAIKTGLNKVDLKGSLETGWYHSYHLDGLIQNKFILGIGYNSKHWSYQDKYEKYLENGDTVIAQGAVQLNRTSITLRAGYSFVSNEKHLAYGGLRLGTTIWKLGLGGDLNVSGNEELGKSLSSISIPITLPTGHLFLGYQYYFIKNLGVHAELGAGFGPYTLQGGINIRI